MALMPFLQRFLAFHFHPDPTLLSLGVCQDVYTGAIEWFTGPGRPPVVTLQMLMGRHRCR
jgi:hypothetical protein